MVVGADEHQIVERLVPSAAVLPDVVPFPKAFVVFVPWVPATKLAAPLVQLLQPLHERPIPVRDFADNRALPF